MSLKQVSNKCKPGDLFCIPAINAKGESGLVIGRYIEHIEPNVGNLIEVFSRFYSSPPLVIVEVDTTQRLFRPILCSFRFAEVPKWRVLFSDKAYTKSLSKFDDIQLEFGSKIWIGGKLLSTPPVSLKNLEPSICWRTHHLIFRVNAHLAGVFKSEERYDHHRAPPDFRVDSLTGKQKVVAAAELLEGKLTTIRA